MDGISNSIWEVELTFKAFTQIKRVLSRELPRVILSVLIYLLVFCPMAAADETSGEAFYKHLSAIAKSGNSNLIEKLNTDPRTLDWNNAPTVEFKGHLRFLASVKKGSADQTLLFLSEAPKAELSSSPYRIGRILFTEI
ncbi:MAG: hypothetical protein P1P89_11870 [Desulfobacterales bacterium]|nr:hypothetical protein [Desulfobacterales bacterium]